MPVTADQVAEISRTTVDLYRAAEAAILREVTRRLAAGMDTPDWAVTRLGAVSTLRSTVTRVLQLVLDNAATSIRETLARAYRTGQAEATTGIPARLLPRDPDVVRAAAVVAGQIPRAGLIENLAAALVQDVGQRHSNVVRHVTDGYRQVIAEATAVSVAGGLTRRQSAQHAYQRLVDQGLTSFTDVRGRTWRLSSYVEMGVRTVTQRAAVQGQTDRLQSLGLPFVVVSDVAGECVLCRPFEGRILRIDDGPIGSLTVRNPATGSAVTIDVTATLSHARTRGFQHPNCRHSVRAYLPGVTRLPEQPTADPAGDAARQRQRAIERTIRKYKEREAAALDPAAAAGARTKVRLWQSQMRDHLAANPALKRLPYREQIGAGNIPPSARPTTASSATPITPPAAPPTAPPPLPKRTRVTQPPPRIEDLNGLIDLNLSHQVNRDMAKEVFADIIGGDYASLTVEVKSISEIGVGTSRPGILVQGSIYPAGDLDAGPVGEFARGFYRHGDGPLVAVHALLKLDRAHRGKGFASAFNQSLEIWYRQQGIERIEVHANIDVGGYTWATQGFEFADEESAEDVLDRLRFMQDIFKERVDDLREALQTATAERTRELRSQISKLEAQIDAAADILDRGSYARFGSDEFPSSWEISQCGRDHDLGDVDQPWIGKAAMLGSDWHGVKML